jgi:hypothetical protein
MDQFFPEIWSKRIQVIKQRTMVSMKIANQEERAGLSAGDVVHRPIQGDLRVNNYSRVTGGTVQYPTSQDEFMTINQQKDVTVYIDNLDKAQSKYDLEAIFTKRAAYRLGNQIDQTVLAEVLNAGFTFDDGSIG